MPNFDTSSPIGSDNRGQGAAVIRELKLAIQSSLRGAGSEGIEAIFPGASPSTSPVFRYRGKKGNSAGTPTVGNGGLYFDAEKNSLRRDNGTSWDNVSSNIPSGTNMSFYQVTSPVGWTAISQDDKFLRVVSASTTGGGTGGTHPASTSVSHTHAIVSHFHYMYNHRHDLGRSVSPISHGVSSNYLGSVSSVGADVGIWNISSASGSSWWIGASYTNTESRITGNTSGTTASSIAGNFAYADIIIASKD